MVRISWIISLLLLILPSPALAEKRIALVIGNSSYEHTASLPNPSQDAELMATVLKAQRFEVLLHRNADLKKMKRAVAEMANKVRAYGKSTVAVFYYAGHGVQVRQSNYLIPVDARIDSEGDVDIEGLNAASVLESLSDAGASVNVVILDACRNNPYRTSFRSATRGLGRLDGPAGFLIAFSTDPGKVATDGPMGGNSPYTEALAAALSRPGLKIEEAFKNVRRVVYEITRGAQLPWESSSLLDDVYIGGEGSDAVSKQTTRVTNQDEAARIQLQAQVAKATADALAEKKRAEAEIAKAEAALRISRTEMERAQADAARSVAEAAKARAEAELAARAQANVRAALAETERANAGLQSRAFQSPGVLDTTTLFHPAAVPSFNCREYAANPVGTPNRNPQTDILCIEPDAAGVDFRLGQVFRDSNRALSPAAKKDAIARQKQWILVRNQRCAATWDDLSVVERRSQIARCLVTETHARMHELRQ